MKNGEKKPDAGLRLRKMELTDVGEIVRLERLIFPDPWPQSAFTDQFESDLWNELVAESDGRIIGYACFLVAGGECQLANIAVHPDHRRKSVAKRLMEHILQVAADSGCEEVLLEVRVSNQQAILFYRSFGFKELFERPGYYSKPKENALVMILSLNVAPDGV